MEKLFRSHSASDVYVGCYLRRSCPTRCYAINPTHSPYYPFKTLDLSSGEGVLTIRCEGKYAKQRAGAHTLSTTLLLANRNYRAREEYTRVLATSLQNKANPILCSDGVVGVLILVEKS